MWRAKLIKCLLRRTVAAQNGKEQKIFKFLMHSIATKFDVYNIEKHGILNQKNQLYQMHVVSALSQTKIEIL